MLCTAHDAHAPAFAAIMRVLGRACASRTPDLEAVREVKELVKGLDGACLGGRVHVAAALILAAQRMDQQVRRTCSDIDGFAQIWGAPSGGATVRCGDVEHFNLTRPYVALRFVPLARKCADPS